VFVYATKSQRATRQSQRLRLCRAIKSRTRATKSRDKIAGVTSALERDSLTSRKQRLSACRSAAGGIRNLGVVSLAFRRAVLSTEDNADRDDCVCIHPDDRCLYRRTLHCYLPSSAGSLLLTTVEVCHVLNKYQLSQMDPRDALPRAHCALHRDGVINWSRSSVERRTSQVYTG